MNREQGTGNREQKSRSLVASLDCASLDRHRDRRDKPLLGMTQIWGAGCTTEHKPEACRYFSLPVATEMKS